MIYLIGLVFVAAEPGSNVNKKKIPFQLPFYASVDKWMEVDNFLPNAMQFEKNHITLLAS